MEKKKENKKSYYVVFIAFILILLGVIGYFVFYKEEAQAPAEEESMTEAEEIDTSNWLTYENEEYGFSLKYPEGWRTEEKTDNDFPDTVVLLKSTSIDEENKLIEDHEGVIDKTGGIDSLPEEEYYKIAVRVVNDSSSDLLDWAKKEYVLTDQYETEGINIADREGIFINDKSWVTHVIAAGRYSEDYLLVFNRYTNSTNENEDVLILKKIINTFSKK